MSRADCIDGAALAFTHAFHHCPDSLLIDIVPGVRRDLCALREGADNAAALASRVDVIAAVMPASGADALAALRAAVEVL